MVKPLFDSSNPPPEPKAKPSTDPTFKPMTFDGVKPSKPNVSTGTSGTIIPGHGGNAPTVFPSNPIYPMGGGGGGSGIVSNVGGPGGSGTVGYAGIPIQWATQQTEQAPGTRPLSIEQELQITLSPVERNRVAQLVSELNKSTANFAEDIVKEITDQTEKVFQFAIKYNTSTGSEALQQFKQLVQQMTVYRKPTNFFTSLFAEKKTFDEMIAALRISLTQVHTIVAKIESEIDHSKQVQKTIDDCIRICKNYMSVIPCYRAAGALFLKGKPDDHVGRVVQKLEGMYPATLSTAISQLELLSKTNTMLIEQLKDMIEVKIPTWKQNATSIIVISEQKKLQKFDPQIETSFNELIKLI